MGILTPNIQDPMSESLGMPAGMLPPPEPPITPPTQGFGAWASDPRNIAKIAPSLVPQPSAPGITPEASQGLFSDAPPSLAGASPALPKMDLGLPPSMATPAPPTAQQDQQNYPDVYGKPYLKNGQPSKWDRLAAGLMGFGGGVHGNPMAGANYIQGLEQHDLGLTKQNQDIYNQRFIQPQIDAMAVPAAQARLAATQAQTAHTQAETQAMVNPAAPLDTHIGGYENADGKRVEIFQSKQTGKPYEQVMGDVGHKDQAAPSGSFAAYNAQFEKENGRKMNTAELLAYDRQHAQAVHITNTPASQASDVDIEAAARSLIDPRNLTALRDISSLRGNQRLQIFNRAKQLDPNWDPGVTNQRIKFLGQYEDPKGRAAQNRQAINNIVQHAADLSDVNQQYRRSNVKIVNTPINAIARQFGDGVYTQYATTNAVLKDEISLYFAGGYAPTQEQQKTWQKIQSDEAPPSAVEAFAKSIVHVAARRADTFNDQFKKNMGIDDPDMITPQAMNAAERLGVADDLKKYGSGGQISRQTGQPSQPSGAPKKKGAVNDPMGIR